MPQECLKKKLTNSHFAIIVSVANDATSGFQATVFEAADGSKVVAIRGTVTSDPGDMAADFSLVLGTVSMNQIIAMVDKKVPEGLKNIQLFKK
jgi:hypothetical protein